jgi:ankyrin repeat protein
LHNAVAGPGNDREARATAKPAMWIPPAATGTNDTVALLNLLIGRGAALKALNNKGHTPLHVAAMTDNVAAAAVLLDRGAEVDESGALGRTPLHEAVLARNIAVAKFLVARSANVAALDNHRETPLTLARKSANKELMELLEPAVPVP